MKKASFLLVLIIAGCYALQAKDCLDEYMAKYKFPSGSFFKEINIVTNNGKLSFSSSMGNMVLKKNGIDNFSIPAYNGKAVFKRNSANEIIGIKIEILGVVLNGTIEKAPKKNLKEIKTPAPSKVLLPKWFDQPDDIYSY